MRSVCKVSDSVIPFFWLIQLSRAASPAIACAEARDEREIRDAHRPGPVSMVWVISVNDAVVQRKKS